MLSEYLTKHEISQKLNVYVNRVCKNLPEEPFQYLAKIIMEDFPSTDASAAASTDKVEITAIKARQVFDSRGNPTIEVELTTNLGTDVGMVPSGASTGIYEALELRDGGSAYMGKGVMTAVKNVNEIIAPALLGKDPRNQKEIDDYMTLTLDGTSNEWGNVKSKLGANAILGVSIALCRAGARAKKVSLYQHIADLAKNGTMTLPVPSFNIINGGSHAGNKLAFQEFMVLPTGAATFTEAMRMGTEVYHHLKKVINKKYGQDATNVGDEGGFAPNIQSAEEGLDLITLAISNAGYTDKVRIGMDVAAAEFYVAEKGYDLANKIEDQAGQKYLSGQELSAYYEELCSKYDIISIEDPFDQDDFEAYAYLRAKIGEKVQIVGDDLLVTNPKRVQKAIDENACNALLLKINQIGTISESIEAVAMSKAAGWGVMTSHRSGETEDNFIADLAVGLNCGQIKTGAPARSERLSKYNQLLRIEEALGDKAAYAGLNFRNPGPAYDL